MKKTCTVIALMGVLIGCGGKSSDTSTGGGSDTTPAVAKNPWGSFKVGSYETMKMTTTTEVAGNKSNTSMEIKMTLTGLTADKATVESATTMMGNTNKTSIDIPLAATQTTTPPPTGSAPSANVKSGTETLTIAGKSLSCKWTETESEAGGNKTVVKVWMSEEVPGFVVKTVTTTKGTMTSEMVGEVTDYKVM
jgi:hypothetical protein